LAKRVSRLASGAASPSSDFSSFRLILGEIARYVGATAGPSVYLDVALSWSISRVSTHPVLLRAEGRPAISYSWLRLAQHFLRMIASLGVRPLSVIFLGGLASGTVGLGFAALTIVQRVTGIVELPGWSSLMATLLVGFGAMLASIGVVAAFLGVVVTIMLGQPAYTTVTDDNIVFR
jgi:undecaprenyl-phosphate 4-deoxy-4-formamido-L-arabinose transferase